MFKLHKNLIYYITSTLMGILLIYNPSSPVDAQNDRLCERVDLSAFCVIDNHLRRLVYDEWNKEFESASARPKYYLHFKEIVQDIFDLRPWRADASDTGFSNREDEFAGLINSATADPNNSIPDTSVEPIPIPKIADFSRNSSIFTYLDFCELRYALTNSPKQFTPNPFTLNVTEITVDGVRLHNHLHITIKGSLKIKYAFIVVNNQDGWAVGDFNTGVPCSTDCNCTSVDCYQSIANDTIPCMFTSGSVVTHPGQIMIFVKNGTASEIHATWRFAQSTDPALFTRELHFQTLLLEENVSENTFESDCKLKYQFHNIEEKRTCDADNCVYSKRKGKYGWNAQYDILHPTFKTIGAWDYFPKGFISKKQVKCHQPLSKDHYKIEPYPTYEKDSDALKAELASKTCERVNRVDLSDEKPAFLAGALSHTYSALSWVSPAQIYFGNPEALIQKIPNFISPQPNTRSKDEFEKDVQPELSKLRSIQNITDEERCFCPRLGAAPPDKSNTVPRPKQLEGRKDHAIQMVIAWFVLVPLAIFVARHYKETYSKVFFLQEYWWYTIHVLSLVLALVFMIGGMYGIEIKRIEPFNFDDPARVTHAGLGIVALIFFGCHIVLGMFRLKKVNLRKIQIFLHWFFGMFEWCLAIGATAAASFISAGCMSCYGLIVLGVFVVGQILFFVGMHCHMKKVDKKLKLKPKRKYLPPPVMRVFHTNAPDSKFRIWMLIIYVIFCTVCYTAMHLFITLDKKFTSCFDSDLGKTAEKINQDQIEDKNLAVQKND